MDKTLIPVIAVLVIVWLGFFAYMLRLDRMVRQLERQDREQDEL